MRAYKSKRQNKTKTSPTEASAPQGGALSVNAAVKTVDNAVTNAVTTANADINTAGANASANTVQNSEVKVTNVKATAEAAPAITVEELTRALRSCFTTNCQWLCGQVTVPLPIESIMEAFARALEGALYESPLKDFKFAVASERCAALVNIVERKYDGVTRITNVKTAKRL